MDQFIVTSLCKCGVPTLPLDTAKIVSYYTSCPPPDIATWQFRFEKMAPRKGFSPFSRVINEDSLSSSKKWYVLSSQVCGMNPSNYFKRSAVVSNFPEDFCRISSDSLRLVDGSAFDGKGSAGYEIVASTFGLVAVLLRQKPDANAVAEGSTFSLLRGYLNGLDLSTLDREQANNLPASRRRLVMPAPAPVTTPERNDSASPFPMTPPNSGAKSSGAVFSSSPNLKEISESVDMDTPEKAFLIKKRSGRVIRDIKDVCDKHRESLSTVLSNMCAFGDPNTTAILNEVIEEVSVKKGVKRTVEDLVGEGTFEKYLETLRVPDWILLYFKTKARISGRTWQAVINITRLGRTGVSV